MNSQSRVFGFFLLYLPAHLFFPDYRQDLNNYANQAGLTLTYKEASEGPQHAIIWTVTAYSMSS